MRRRAARWGTLLGTLLGALLGAMASLTPGPAGAEVDVPEEIECLALTMYFEARGEPDRGKIAVGHVVMNRALHGLFPQAVCEVVRQGGEKLPYRCQFTWWCDRRSDQPTDIRAWQRIEALARLIYWDYSRDPTGGALWYHALDVSPPWVEGLSRGPTIGRHVFYSLGGRAIGDRRQSAATPRAAPVTDDRIPASYRSY